MINKSVNKWLVIIVILFIAFVIIPIFFKANEGFEEKLKFGNYEFPKDHIVSVINSNLKEVFDNIAEYNELLKTNNGILGSIQSSIQSSNEYNQENNKFVKHRLDRIYHRSHLSNVANRANTASINNMSKSQIENTSKIYDELNSLKDRVWDTPDQIGQINGKLEEYKKNAEQLTADILKNTEGGNLANTEFQRKLFERLKIEP